MNASTLLIILLSLVGLAVLLVVLFSLRRRSISRMNGAFDCSLRVGDSTSHPRWRLGVAVFTVTSLKWYPVFSLGNHPIADLPRADFEILSMTEPDAEEQYAVLPDALVLMCRTGGHAGPSTDVRLAMDAEATAALSSWLESAPPGANRTMGRFT